jgi:hypothetical protein
MKICPIASEWAKVHGELIEYSRTTVCLPPEPPSPLILAGWAYSNDIDKKNRWQETVAWAVANGCSELVLSIPNDLFYRVSKPTSYTVGPMGGPMYLLWNFEARSRPSTELIESSIVKLKADWPSFFAGNIYESLEPVRFTGKKCRRLLVNITGEAVAPWGDWGQLPRLETERRKFTALRKAINLSIFPHEVDHVDFRKSSR